MRSWKVEFSEAAYLDIQDSFLWYNNHSEKTGATFLADIDKVVSTLSINPYFQIRYKTVRCLRLRRFPHLVHFVVDDTHNLVRIVAIMHTSKKWPD
jgi:plasmid stabilization system protein ParE